MKRLERLEQSAAMERLERIFVPAQVRLTTRRLGASLTLVEMG
jgi:hypothetical protein